MTDESTFKATTYAKINQTFSKSFSTTNEITTKTTFTTTVIDSSLTTVSNVSDSSTTPQILEVIFPSKSKFNIY